ncbi:hypothetical protein ALC56_01196, partial [Trachymyrmex septentrionalis]
VSNLKKIGVENITLHAVETRINLFEKLWAKCKSQHEFITKRTLTFNAAKPRLNKISGNSL